VPYLEEQKQQRILKSKENVKREEDGNNII